MNFPGFLAPSPPHHWVTQERTWGCINWLPLLLSFNHHVQGSSSSPRMGSVPQPPAPWDTTGPACSSSPAGSPGMSPLLPHPSAYSGRRPGSQQAVTASGRLQLILLEGVSLVSSPRAPRGLSSYLPNTSMFPTTEPSPPRLGHQHEVVRTTEPATQGTGITLQLYFHDLMLYFPYGPCLTQQTGGFSLFSISSSRAQPRGPPCSRIIELC